jgi:hypothetical protein
MAVIRNIVLVLIALTVVGLLAYKLLGSDEEVA